MTYLVVALLAFAGVYLWMRLRGRRERSGDDADPSVPPNALVWLLSAPLEPDQEEITRRIEKVLGIRMPRDNPEATEFLVPMPPLPGMEGLTSFLIQTGGDRFLIHFCGKPYVDQPETWADLADDLALADAVRAHRAWVSVDIFGDAGDGEHRAWAEKNQGLIARALHAPEAVGLYHTRLQAMISVGPGLLPRLGRDAPEDVFQESLLGRIVNVADDDPRLVAAVEEARLRWPEFIDAFSRRSPENHCSAKFRFEDGEEVEYMWMEVTEIDGNIVRGTLASAPFHILRLKENDPVECTLDRLNDWLVASDHGKPLGGFTIKAIAEIEHEG